MKPISTTKGQGRSPDENLSLGQAGFESSTFVSVVIESDLE